MRCTGTTVAAAGRVRTPARAPAIRRCRRRSRRPSTYASAGCGPDRPHENGKKKKRAAQHPRRQVRACRVHAVPTERTRRTQLSRSLRAAGVVSSGCASASAPTRRPQPAVLLLPCCASSAPRLCDLDPADLVFWPGGRSSFFFSTRNVLWVHAFIGWLKVRLQLRKKKLTLQQVVWGLVERKRSKL